VSGNLTRYAEEKADGTRAPNGALRLSKLSGKHLRIINLHLQGVKGAAIADIMGCTQAWVSTVLNDPLARDVIARRFVDCDNEMMVQSTQVVRESMEQTEDRALQLRAADMVWRARGRYEKKASESLTAEDIVQRMLRIAKEMGQVSLTVTAGDQASVASRTSGDATIEGSAE